MCCLCRLPSSDHLKPADAPQCVLLVQINLRPSSLRRPRPHLAADWLPSHRQGLREPEEAGVLPSALGRSPRRGGPESGFCHPPLPPQVPSSSPPWPRSTTTSIWRLSGCATPSRTPGSTFSCACVIRAATYPSMAHSTPRCPHYACRRIADCVPATPIPVAGLPPPGAPPPRPLACSPESGAPRY